MWRRWLRISDDGTTNAGDANERVRKLETEVDKMKANGRVWAKQRTILVHNMATVLKTAQAEVSRKDGQIRKLRKD